MADMTDYYGGGHYTDTGEWIPNLGPDPQPIDGQPPAAPTGGPPPVTGPPPGPPNPDGSVPKPPGSAGDPVLTAMWESSGHDINKFVKAYIAANGLVADQKNPAALQKIVDAINVVSPGAAKMDTPDSQGRLEGIIVNGTPMQAINGSGWADLAPWPPGGNQQGPPDLSGNGINQSYLSPYTKSFSDFYGNGTNPAGALGAGTPSGSLNPPEFQDPGAFQAPTAESITSDPSYQFRMDQGRGQIENSAAGKGLLNSGGTLYDILNYGQKAASQEYGNIYQRDLGLWDQNYQHAVTDYGLKAGVNDTAYNRAWTQYMNNRDTFYKNQQNPFDKIMQGVNTGVGAG